MNSSPINHNKIMLLLLLYYTKRIGWIDLSNDGEMIKSNNNMISYFYKYKHVLLRLTQILLQNYF